MIFKSILLATLLVASGAFVPNNANPFQKKHTHGRVTSFLSSANKNDFGDDDSFGFFDDDEFEDRIPRKGDAFEFIFDIDDDMKPEDVHIILFNPDTDREGVHTIEFPKGSGSNMILAFESRKECEQFSMSLREQQFFDPTVSTGYL